MHKKTSGSKRKSVVAQVPHVPDEIWLEIFYYIDEMAVILKLRLLSKYHKNFVDFTNLDKRLCWAKPYLRWLLNVPRFRDNVLNIYTAFKLVRYLNVYAVPQVLLPPQDRGEKLTNDLFIRGNKNDEKLIIKFRLKDFKKEFAAQIKNIHYYRSTQDVHLFIRRILQWLKYDFDSVVVLSPKSARCINFILEPANSPEHKNMKENLILCFLCSKVVIIDFNHPQVQNTLKLINAEISKQKIQRRSDHNRQVFLFSSGTKPDMKQNPASYSPFSHLSCLTNYFRNDIVCIAEEQFLLAYNSVVSFCSLLTQTKKSLKYLTFKTCLYDVESFKRVFEAIANCVHLKELQITVIEESRFDYFHTKLRKLKLNKLVILFKHDTALRSLFDNSVRNIFLAKEVFLGLTSILYDDRSMEEVKSDNKILESIVSSASENVEKLHLYLDEYNLFNIAVDDVRINKNSKMDIVLEVLKIISRARCKQIICYGAFKKMYEDIKNYYGENKVNQHINKNIKFRTEKEFYNGINHYRRIRTWYKNTSDIESCFYYDYNPGQQ